jgi:hypothetical protein
VIVMYESTQMGYRMCVLPIGRLRPNAHDQSPGINKEKNP